MAEIAEFMAEILIKKGIPRIKSKVTEFKKRYQRIHYCFDEGRDAYRCFLHAKVR